MGLRWTRLEEDGIWGLRKPTGWFKVSARKLCRPGIHRVVIFMGHTWLTWGQRGRVQGPPATLAAERSVSQFPISYCAKPGLSIWEQTLTDSRKSG